MRWRRPWQRLWRRFWWLYLRPRTLGERGERAARRFLQARGYIIIACGKRGPFGELDIIAVDGRTVVFVEVKTRRSHDTGHPADAVDLRKRRRLTRLALAYLKRHQLLEQRARFDIVAVTWPEGAKTPAIQHFPDAFEPTEPWNLFA